jgi:hypothetical protein
MDSIIAAWDSQLLGKSVSLSNETVFDGVFERSFKQPGKPFHVESTSW